MLISSAALHPRELIPLLARCRSYMPIRRNIRWERMYTKKSIFQADRAIWRKSTFFISHVKRVTDWAGSETETKKQLTIGRAFVDRWMFYIYKRIYQIYNAWSKVLIIRCKVGSYNSNASVWDWKDIIYLLLVVSIWNYSILFSRSRTDHTVHTTITNHHIYIFSIHPPGVRETCCGISVSSLFTHSISSEDGHAPPYLL